MIVVNPCANRTPVPKPQGLELDLLVKEETYSSVVLDVDGHPTDQFMQHTVERVVRSNDMPIDQSLSSDMFDLQTVIEQNQSLQPVKGYSIGSETVENVFGHLSSAEQTLFARASCFIKETEPKTEPKTESKTEPKTE